MRKISLLAFVATLIAPLARAATPTVGDIPPPVLKNISVVTQVTTTQGQFGTYYIFNYTISSPATNTGYIWNIQLDVSAPQSYQYDVPGDLTVPRAGEGVVPFYILEDETLNFDPLAHENVVPFGITAPDGWVGSVTVNQTGGFWAGDGTKAIAPGQNVGGFTMTSGLPTIRTMSLIPYWVPTFANGEASESDSIKAQQIEDSLVEQVTVLGPSYTSGNTYDHWNQFRSDINSAIQLGWVTDSTFASTVLSDLQAARSTMDTKGDTSALPGLQKMLTDVQGSTATQRNDEAYALLLYNLQDLINSIPPDDPVQPPPPSPKATFVTPSTSAVTAAVGTSVTVVERVVDQANNSAPLVGYQSPITIDGPDADQTPDPVAGGLTDSNGQISVTITGEQVGVDSVKLPFQGTHELHGGQVSEEIVWNGGPDLTVSNFRPPIIVLNSHAFEVSDTTRNIGNTPAPPSNTYYLMADSFPVENSNTFYIVDWRSVPALQPGESNTGVVEEDLTGIVPDGQWYLIACANWDRQIAETDYSNNCNDGQLVGVVQRNGTSPPDCSKAAPSAKLLWPPNHQFVNVIVSGVTDPANLVPAITITGIQQDEPVNAKGDGNTAPDGAGIGTSVAQVRSERSGTAVGGRLYFISFSAKDSAGGSCTGTVAVGVPHDQGQHAMPTDNGQRYDSTSLH